MLRVVISVVTVAMLAASAQAFEREWFDPAPAADSGASWLRETNGFPCCVPRNTLMLWNSDEEPAGGPPPFDEPLASDRPDFTEASSTVGQNVCQIEMGYTYLFDDEAGTEFRGHSYPEVLARIGLLAEWLEFRVGWNYANERTRTDGVTTEAAGAEDLYVGLKLGLTPQQGIFPEMALMPQMTLPTGARAFTTDQTLPGVNWLYGWDICDWLSTAGSTQVNINIDPTTDDEYLEFAQSWTIGYTLSEKVGAYTEWFMITPCGAETAFTEHYLDGGFTYRATNNLQFDIRAGKGLSDRAVDYFTGAGAVVRF